MAPTDTGHRDTGRANGDAGVNQQHNESSNCDRGGRNVTKLRLWIGAMAGWLFVLFNVERIHEPINIASFVYVYTAAIVALLICVPRIHSFSPYLLSTLLVSLFVLCKSLIGYEVDGIRLPLTITEGCAILVTILLSRKVVQSIAEFERAAIDAILMQQDRQLSSFDMQQAEIYREIRRARQFNRPLALVALAPTPQSVEHSLSRFVQEVQQKAVETYVHARVAEVLSDEVSHCDLIARRNSHFVMLLPETNGAGANALARRLKDAVEARLGLKLHAGTACFPEQEVTFSGLLERAEAEMRQGGVKPPQTEPPQVEPLQVEQPQMDRQLVSAG